MSRVETVHNQLDKVDELTKDLPRKDANVAQLAGISTLQCHLLAEIIDILTDQAKDKD